ncbi:MAG: hypothetical protein P8186_03955 [Anaerolineae bacterium]
MRAWADEHKNASEVHYGDRQGNKPTRGVGHHSGDDGKPIASSTICGTVEAWMLLDANLRMAYLNTNPEFVKMQQLVIVKTAILNHSINCTGHNVDLARAVDITWEQLDLLEGDDWNNSELFSNKEKAVIRWADEVSTQRAYDNDAAFEELKKYFDTHQIVELTFLCCMWNLSGRLTEALHLMVEPPGERIGFGCSI